MSYAFPQCLAGRVAPAVYSRWLQRKAAAHVKRDRRRGNSNATVSAYKQAIHNAVVASGGRDAYTGEDLDWSLISQYDNEKSKQLGRSYKKELAALPTLDHVGDGLGHPDFVISSWRTNDAKHDLTLQEFLALCAAVLKYHGYSVAEG
ncbi:MULTISPECIES: hypothetical protein [Metallibacterium]|jgi:hypothetical protein|uniref:hypothetical protein n=1 Tax=Metallibacterium TaxID=1218803 RepID=UPI002615E199|nr:MULTISPECIES: hypothetical protein [Metallibacterium]